MKSEITIEVRRLPDAEDLPLPAYESEHASGMDLRAALNAPMTLAPGARAAVSTGLCVAIPPGFEGQVRPRSGLAIRQGLTMINAPGTIDADYRGEIKVLLVNLGDGTVILNRGDRIAQLIIAPVVHANWSVVSSLDDTKRGEGGFGHTGLG